MYFPKKKLRILFSDLAERFSGEILCDLRRVWVSKNSHRHDALKKMDARFAFGINDETQIASWHSKIQHEKTALLMKRHPKRWGFWAGRIMANIPFFKNSCKLTTYRLG